MTDRDTKASTKRRCIFCGKATPPLDSDGDAHRACVAAYGLDYDPTSEADARQFLDRRAAWIASQVGQEGRGADRAAHSLATPRPWVATKHGDTKGWTISSLAGSNSIASVRPNPRRVAGPEEVEANAALIVAAVNSYHEREAELARLRAREQHFAQVLGVADGGQYRNDWDARLQGIVSTRDGLSRELELVREELRVARETAESLARGLRHIERLAGGFEGDPHDTHEQMLLIRGAALRHLKQAQGQEPRRDDDPVHTTRDDFAPDGLEVKP